MTLYDLLSAILTVFTISAIVVLFIAALIAAYFYHKD